MDNILLDHEQPEEPPKKPIYAYTAVATSIITFMLMVGTFAMLPEKIGFGGIFEIPNWLTKGVKFFYAVSIVLTIFSLASKEKSRVKWLAVGINLLVLLAFIALVWYIRSLSSRL